MGSSSPHRRARRAWRRRRLRTRSPHRTRDGLCTRVSTLNAPARPSPPCREECSRTISIHRTGWGSRTRTRACASSTGGSLRTRASRTGCTRHSTSESILSPTTQCRRHQRGRPRGRLAIRLPIGTMPRRHTAAAAGLRATQCTPACCAHSRSRGRCTPASCSGSSRCRALAHRNGPSSWVGPRTALCST